MKEDVHSDNEALTAAERKTLCTFLWASKSDLCGDGELAPAVANYFMRGVFASAVACGSCLCFIVLEVVSKLLGFLKLL